jgi:hypothetical protein
VRHRTVGQWGKCISPPLPPLHSRLTHLTRSCSSSVPVGALLFIPDQNLFLTVSQDLLAATLFGGAFALLIVGNLVNALNE